MQRRDRPAPVRRPLQRRVVVDDDHAVARQVDVELEPVGAERQAVIEGREGVLGRERAPAAVREHQRARRSGQRADVSRHATSWLTLGATIALMIPSNAAQPSARLRKCGRGRARRPAARSKTEIRDNLIRKLRAGEPLFPGIIGYDDTVVPQLVNAILSRHNFILLGLRGQAKSRILRALTDAARRAVPVVPGCEIHDDPLAPMCARAAPGSPTRATRCRSRGCRATRATSRSWRRPT